MFNKIIKVTIKTKLNDHFAIVRLADTLAVNTITCSMETNGDIEVIFEMRRMHLRMLKANLKTLAFAGIKAEIKET